MEAAEKQPEQKQERSLWEKFKKYTKRIWRFLVHEDSWASFVADAILIVLIGKFVALPLIGLVMGTPLPAVAVVTSSMDHHGLDFDSWWAQNSEWYIEHNITKAQFEQFYLKNGFVKGDIMIMKGVDVNDLKVGDIIVYHSPVGIDIIHRVIWTNGEAVGVKGDANSDQLSFEKKLTQEDIKGRAIGKVPKLGWVKVIFVDLFNKLR